MNTSDLISFFLFGSTVELLVRRLQLFLIPAYKPKVYFSSVEIKILKNTKKYQEFKIEKKNLARPSTYNMYKSPKNS